MTTTEPSVKNVIGRLFKPSIAALRMITAGICLCGAATAGAPADQVQVKNPTPAADVSYRTENFAIPSQPLVTALDRFGEKTGIHIFYNSRLTQDIFSPGVSGRLSAEEALQKLLAGTPLVPVATGANSITLVLNPELATFATLRPVEAPVLALQTMRVEAPPAMDFRLFATTVRYSLLNALQKDPGLKARSFQAIVDVWVSPSGNIQNSELQLSTGNTEVDGAITKTVLHVVIGRSPPLGLPQPVHVKVLTAGVP